jgi:phosphatidate cytidylyltransferase
MMENSATLITALGTAFGVGGLGIVVATRGSLARLRHSTLTKRYLTWLLLAIAYGIPVLLGRPGVVALATALAIQAAREAAALLHLAGPYRLALLALCALLPPFAFVGVGDWSAGLLLLVAAGLPILRGRPSEAKQASGLAFGALLVGWTLAHLVTLAQAGQGWVVLALFGTAVSDVCAFTVGSRLGGPRLAPRISPGKTWSGLGGNLVGAALALLLLAPMLPPLSLPAQGALALAIGLGGCFGDLIESALKREAGVKDAAAWLPGFGGLLDRIDSLLVVAPLLALLASVIR